MLLSLQDEVVKLGSEADLPPECDELMADVETSDAEAVQKVRAFKIKIEKTRPVHKLFQDLWNWGQSY